MRADLVDLLSRLVATDSVNPSLVPGGAGEGPIARLISEWAGAAGLDVEIVEDTPARPSVVVTARGAGAGRTLLLCAHTDTVGVAGMERPHDPYLEGKRLYGRGAFDMKGSLAALMLVTAEARKRRLAGDVVLTAVADEEAGSVGT